MIGIKTGITDTAVGLRSSGPSGSGRRRDGTADEMTENRSGISPKCRPIIHIFL